MASPAQNINITNSHVTIINYPPVPTILGRAVAHPYQPPGPVPSPAGFSASSAQPQLYRAIPALPVKATVIEEDVLEAADILADLFQAAHAAHKPVKHIEIEQAPAAAPKKKSRSEREKYPVIENGMLSANLFRKLIPLGTTVYHKGGQRVKIAGIPDAEGMIRVRGAHDSDLRVPVSELKPLLPADSLVLMIDPADPWKRHAVARIEDSTRGNIKAVWEEFGRSSAHSSTHGANALARIIPIANGQLRELPRPENIRCTLNDDTETTGDVYTLLESE